MLHRMKLRVVYRAALASAGPAVTRQKWLLMALAGLAAYSLYKKAAALSIPVDDARLVLLVSGVAAAPVAVVAYAYGLGWPVRHLWRARAGLLAVIGLRVGVLYAWQLSLMVLALLDVIVGYGFLAHPSGPGLMAVLISASAVARDAHEIGTLHKMTGLTASRWAVPDGHGLAVLWGSRGSLESGGLRRWVLAAACAGGLLAALLAPFAGGRWGGPIVLAATGTAVGVIGVQAYVAARQAPAEWRETLVFFVWPAFTFFCTYALTLFGAFRYVVMSHNPLSRPLTSALLSAASAGLLALNCWHLGVLKRQTRLAQTGQVQVPEALLRCPFVLDLISKQKQA